MVFLSTLHFTISAHSSDTVLCGLHTKYRGNNSCLWMALLGRRIWPSLEKMLHEIFLPGHWPLGSLMMSQYGPGAKISHSTDSSVQCPRSAVARIDVQGDYSSGARGRPTGPITTNYTATDWLSPPTSARHQGRICASAGVQQ